MRLASLGGLQRVEDPRLGVAEELPAERFGPHARSTGFLTTPLGSAGPVALVICRPPGAEAGPFRRLEALAARRLAAAGVPVLRFRRAAEEDGRPGRLSFENRVEEASAGVDFLRDYAARVGVVGALGGAAVALAVAVSRGLDLAVLWEPIRSGEAYVRLLLRREEAEQTLAGMFGDELPAVAGPALVGGLVLDDAALAGLRAVDVGALADRFRGDALLVRLGKSDRDPLASRLAAEGARVRRVKIDGSRLRFGTPHLRAVLAGKSDIRIALDRQLADATVTWLRSLSP